MKYEIPLKVEGDNVGIHLRPACMIANVLQDTKEKFGVDMALYDQGKRYEGGMQILTMGKLRGQTVDVRAEGERGKEALDYFLKRTEKIFVRNGDCREIE